MIDHRTPETFERWLGAFEEALDHLVDGQFPACPNCGRFDLELRFVADSSSRLGFAAMWSAHCRHGIRIARVEVPDGVTFVPLDAPDDVIARATPKFQDVRPTF